MATSITRPGKGLIPPGNRARAPRLRPRTRSKTSNKVNKRNSPGRTRNLSKRRRNKQARASAPVPLISTERESNHETRTPRRPEHGLGLVPLALLVAALFFAEATLELILYLQTRATLGSGWMLFDGILTLLLALVLGLTGASSPLWALGFIAGISMLVSGISRLMLSKPGSVGEK